MTELIAFLQDDKAIRDERKKARKNRDKYTGVSSDEFSGSGFGPSKSKLIFNVFVQNYSHIKFSQPGQ